MAYGDSYDPWADVSPSAPAPITKPIPTPPKPFSPSTGGSHRFVSTRLALCEGETEIRSYCCAELQSKFMRKKKDTASLVVTNKRVVFATTGSDKNYMHSELLIEDVSGIALQKGRFFDFTKLFVIYGLFIGLPLMIISAISTIIAVMAKIKVSELNQFVFFAVAGVIVIVVIKMIYDKKFNKILDFLSPFKPSFTLKVTSKGGENGAINISSSERFGFIDISAEIVPVNEAMTMIIEIGAIINDIQKMGDLAIGKWKK